MTTDKLTPYLTPLEIAVIVEGLAHRLNKDFTGRDVVVIGILKGAVFFLADLVRHLDFSHILDFLQVSSYGSGTTAGPLTLCRKGTEVLEGRRVILVDDIIDTGFTARFLVDYVLRCGARQCELCVLLDKPSGRKVPVPVAYRGLAVPDRFFVGYGMDLDDRYRSLGGLYYLESPGKAIS